MPPRKRRLATTTEILLDELLTEVKGLRKDLKKIAILEPVEQPPVRKKAAAKKKETPEEE
jgi:hypothetical protein